MTRINALIDRLIHIQRRTTAETAVFDVMGDAIDELEKLRDKTLPLGLRLATILDAVRPLIDKEAAAENRREAGKTLRRFTAQGLAKVAAEAVAAAEAEFGYNQ